MTIQRVAALINPSARHGLAGEASDAAVEALTAAGLEVTPLLGASADEALELARTAQTSDHDAVVVVGGDGTIRLALQAVYEAGVDALPIGLMPAGTGNDTARALGIPIDDHPAAAAIIAGGARRLCDTATITLADGSIHAFGTVAATGLDALVTERANTLPWPKGQLRYPIAAVIELARMKPFPYEISVDGQHMERDLVLASVGNTASYGGGMQITPAALIDDGHLDVILVHHGSRLKLMGMFPTIYSGKHIHRKEVEQLRGRRIELRSSRTTPIYADGDRIGELPAVIEVRPGAVSFLASAALGGE
ncbi:diacylglycerol kinase [Williamsia sp.]|uniref:diacylglycerol kinase n=1 Tax=Williamsia sp. TaxID=1872085 RepID=UPI002F9578B9